jgi:hypothetical protein
LDIVENDYDDVAFYDNHGKINGTKAYNDFNDALDASYDLARKTHQWAITLDLFRLLKLALQSIDQRPSKLICLLELHLTSLAGILRLLSSRLWNTVN